jgi:hypothetical protein
MNQLEAEVDRQNRREYKQTVLWKTAVQAVTVIIVMTSALYAFLGGAELLQSIRIIVICWLVLTVIIWRGAVKSTRKQLRDGTVVYTFPSQQQIRLYLLACGLAIVLFGGLAAMRFFGFITATF